MGKITQLTGRITGRITGRTLGLGAAAGMISVPAAALAAQPVDWQIWHQEAGSAMMRAIEWFDLYTLWFIVPITLLVLGLLLIVILRFNAKANPVPSKTSHNTPIEIIWTIGPILILVALAIPSFQLLTSQFNPPEEPALTIKAIGHQWYWEYEYQDESELSFDSVLIGRNLLSQNAEEKSKAEAEMVSFGKQDRKNYPYLLAVDNELVVPVNKTIRVLVTANADGVIHNFAMPAFGLKMDAIPGRNNETWFKAEREGLYYGQCSELCGRDHAFMPIGIRVVSDAQFQAWQQAAKNDVSNANKALMATIKTDNKSVEIAGN